MKSKQVKEVQSFKPFLCMVCVWNMKSEVVFTNTIIIKEHDKCVL